MARKRSKKNKKNKMASKRILNSTKEETDLSKKIKLKLKLISVTISKKHPEIDINDHEIQKILLIFNLLIEAEPDKSSNAPEDSENGIPDILITIAGKIFTQQYRFTKTSRYYKRSLKKIKIIYCKR